MSRRDISQIADLLSFIDIIAEQSGERRYCWVKIKELIEKMIANDFQDFEPLP